MDIISYINNSKSSFIESINTNINYIIVTGNEAFDMDSFASSLSFAYLLYNESIGDGNMYK